MAVTIGRRNVKAASCKQRWIRWGICWRSSHGRQRTVTGAGQRLRASRASGDGRAGVCGSRLHGLATGGSSSPARDKIGSGQTHGNQTRLCAAAQTVGGRAFVRVGGTLSATGARIRTPRGHVGRLPLARLRFTHAQLAPCQKCMTGPSTGLWLTSGPGGEDLTAVGVKQSPFLLLCNHDRRRCRRESPPHRSPFFPSRAPAGGGVLQIGLLWRGEL